MDVERLRGLPPLEGVSEAGLERVAARAADVSREAGQVLALPDDPGSGMYVIREGTDIYRGAVNIAARISGLTAPGEVVVSATVRELARTSAEVAFEDRGERELRGVGEPVRVFAVRAEDETAS